MTIYEFTHMGFILQSLEINFQSLLTCPLSLKWHPSRLSGTNFLSVYLSCHCTPSKQETPPKVPDFSQGTEACVSGAHQSAGSWLGQHNGSPTLLLPTLTHSTGHISKYLSISTPQQQKERRKWKEGEMEKGWERGIEGKRKGKREKEKRRRDERKEKGKTRAACLEWTRTRKK